MTAHRIQKLLASRWAEVNTQDVFFPPHRTGGDLSLLKCHIITHWIKLWHTKEISGCDCDPQTLSRSSGLFVMKNNRPYSAESEGREAPLHLSVEGCTKARSNALWLDQTHLSLSQLSLSRVRHYSCWGHEIHWGGGNLIYMIWLIDSRCLW